MPGAKTYYEILGLRPDAATEEVRRVYRALAREHHPDRVRDPEEKKRAEELFTAMTEAFNVLADAGRRREYDEKLRAQASGEGSAQGEARKYFRVGQARLQEGNAAEAVRMFKAALHLDSAPATYYAHLAQAHEAASAFGEAVRAWDEAIKREPYNARNYRMAGQCLERAGMRIRARKMYELAVKWDRNDAASADALRRLSGEEEKKGGLGGLFKRS